MIRTTEVRGTSPGINKVWILGSTVMVTPCPGGEILTREWVLHVLQFAYDTTGHGSSRIIGKW